MKKIGIDARLINETGVGTYIKNLLSNLPYDKDVKYIIYDYKKSPFRWHSFSEQINFLDQINKDDLDLMHFTYFSYPYFYNKPFIITIHDLTPFFFKTGKASTKNLLIYEIKHFIYKLLLKNAIKKAKQIITPSNTVKIQIGEVFGKKYLEKITVTYEGLSDLFLNNPNTDNQIKLKNIFGNNFFIYVGNFYPHKNIEKLIEAFKKIDSKLILIGKEDYFSAKIKNLVLKNKMQNKILFFKNATPDDLIFFYKNAKALIFPSISEGFGLPPIEAMYFDCPVIASDIPIFNEILENNFIKFDPNSVLDIQEKIKSFSAKKINLNKNTFFEKFSFKKMAIETGKIYKKYL